MASSIVQSAATNATTASVVVTLGATPTVGNTLLAFVSSDTTHTSVPTAGTSKPFVQRLSQVNSQGFYVWTRAVVSGDTATITFTPSSAAPTSAQVLEIQGTYDLIGTVASTASSAAASRTTNSITPTNADNTVLALAGIHNIGTLLTNVTVNNTFTIAQTNLSTTTGTAVANTVAARKFTGAATATGVTTISWTNNAVDQDGVQVAFAGIGGAAASIPPELVMAPIRR